VDLVTRVLNERLQPRSTRVVDAVLPALLPFLVAQTALLTVAATAARLFGLPSKLAPLLVYGLLAVAVAVVLPAILTRADPRVWLLGGIWLSAFAVGVLIGQGSGDFYVTIAEDLLIGLGWMTVASAVRDYRRCRRYLYAAAPVILLAVIIELWSPSSEAANNASYSQYIAYEALPAVLIFIDATFESRRVVNGALAIVSAVLMLSAGARGPLVVVALFIIARIVLHIRESPRAAIVTAGVGAAATLLLAQFYSAILGALQPVLERSGLSTRVVVSLLNGTVFEDRARSELIDHTLNIINQHPFTGVGMSNERPILARWMGAPVETESLGWYPHNVFLELWAQFGVILGTLLLMLLLGAILRVLVGSVDLDRRALVLVFVGLGLLPLLFSASYLSWPPFFGLVGLCLPIGSQGNPLPSEGHRDASRY
jgi:O-antigen ligase